MYFGRWTGKGSKVTWKRKVDRLVIPCLKKSTSCLVSGLSLDFWFCTGVMESGFRPIQAPRSVSRTGRALTPQRSAAAAVQLDYVPRTLLPVVNESVFFGP